MPRRLLHWTLRERHKVSGWIRARAKRMLRAVDHTNRYDQRRVWRRAVESGLRCRA